MNEKTSSLRRRVVVVPLSIVALVANMLLLMPSSGLLMPSMCVGVSHGVVAASVVLYLLILSGINWWVCVRAIDRKLRAALHTRAQVLNALALVLALAVIVVHAGHGGGESGIVAFLVMLPCAITFLMLAIYDAPTFLSVVCPACGYDLRGSDENGDCPECGRRFQKADIKKDLAAYQSGPTATVAGNRTGRVWWIAVLVIPFLFHVGWALLQQDRIIARSRQFSKAVEAGEYRVAYDTLSPTLRSELTFEKFVSDFDMIGIDAGPSRISVWGWTAQQHFRALDPLDFFDGGAVVKWRIINGSWCIDETEWVMD